MHEYYRLKKAVAKVLSNFGFTESIPDTETDGCGSIFCMYVSAGKRFIIEWDGEEGFGLVQSWQGGTDWQALEPIVPESTELELQRNISALCAEVRRQL